MCTPVAVHLLYLTYDTTDTSNSVYHDHDHPTQVYLCEQFGLKEVADYWAKVVDMNNHQQVTFTKRIIDAMFNTVSGKKVRALFTL